MISGTDPLPKAITGVPLAIASISTRPNGSGQLMGKSSAIASPRKAPLSLSPDLTDELDHRIFEQRLDPRPVIRTIGSVDLCHDRQRQPSTAGDLDCAVRSLLRTDSANKGEIAAITRTRSVEARR